MNSECTNPACQPADTEAEWQALRYTLGEMSPAEAEDFEARLADEQRLRELLAANVELVAAVDLVEGESAVMAPAAAQPRPRRLLWPLASAAACAAVVLAALLLPGPAVSPPGEETAANELPAIWSQQLADANEPGEDSEAAVERPELAPVVPEAVSDEFDVPGWMIAAVSIDEVGTNGPSTMEN